MLVLSDLQSLSYALCTEDAKALQDPDLPMHHV